MGFEEKTPNLMALLKARTGSASLIVPVMPWCPDHLLLLLDAHPLVMQQKRKEKWANEAKAPRMLRKEKSLTPLSSPQPKMPKQLRLSRRRVPIGTSKEPKGE